jgi:hypothetical protein
LNDSARFSLILWSRLCNWKEALVIVKPETLIGWHRKDFKLFWKWKSQAGRPRLPESIRKLIVQMAQENPTWGQARVAAELSVKLGIHVSPRTVRAYWPPEPATGPQEDLFAELEGVCPQSRPVHRRLRFPGRSDRSISNALCVHPYGGWDTAHRALQRHRASNGSLDLTAVSRSDSERSFLPFPDSVTVTRSSRQRWTEKLGILGELVGFGEDETF